MASRLVFAFCFFSFLLQLEAAKSHSNINNPQITVMGIVYCDICSNNSFSRHSYFLPGCVWLCLSFDVNELGSVFWEEKEFDVNELGVEVRIDCMFNAIAPRTAEQISFSVNRTTNKYGIYRLEVPSVDGVQCARDKAVKSTCRATLLSTSSKACAIPGFQSTSDQISIKSKRANMCIYSLNALSYRPSKRDTALCGK
ncbi:hypothetical protein SASPL_106734 [Salvia splendens]|uniref:Pollen allergen Ole e 1 family n=1 Tax=Salvia splendens TaxID=180675 RepID=A0A8X8YP64_SALSN|nr:hypothetical protein SASPL_106734 [Salvia splendens]